MLFVSSTKEWGERLFNTQHKKGKSPLNPKTSTPQAHEREPTHHKALTLDLEKYLAPLKDWDISEDQKTEFIYTLWNLLRNFAEIGFEIHPAQQALESTDKPPEKPDLPALCAQYMLSSTPVNHTHLDEQKKGLRNETS